MNVARKVMGAFQKHEHACCYLGVGKNHKSYRENRHLDYLYISWDRLESGSGSPVSSSKRLKVPSGVPQTKLNNPIKVLNWNH